MKSVFTLLILLSVFASYAQNATEAGKKVKSNQPSTEYGRVSLSYLLLDFNKGDYNDLLKQAFLLSKVSDKFDDNTTAHRFVPTPVTREEADQAFLINPRAGNGVTNKIGKALKDGHYINDVIAKWFSRKEDGSFGVELLQQRGLYNATDADVMTANASKLGTA